MLIQSRREGEAIFHEDPLYCVAMPPNCSMATGCVFSHHGAALRRISYLLQSIFRIVGQQLENSFVHASPTRECERNRLVPGVHDKTQRPSADLDF